MTGGRISIPPYSLWESRQGSGSPIALIHGLSGSSRWWSRNIDALAGRHLVAAIDLLGFGKTSRFFELPKLPPFSEQSALVARWLETFGEPVHLFGHSMGGFVAIRVAAERPELVRSLVLVNAAGMPFHLDPRPHIRSLPRPPYGGPGIARVLLPDLLRAGPASVTLASARLIAGDVREAMHAVQAPTLLVWGENDPLVPARYGEAMQREIPGSQLAVIRRAAHVAMWDAPAAFNEEALRFLDAVERTPPLRPSRRALFSWGVSGWWEGVAHRQAGSRRNLVLVHGLGMSSRYFERFASTAYGAGWDPVAPDLPGFGESDNAPAAGPEEHAEILARWAEALGIRDAVWMGHSIGCNAVAHLAVRRPDLVRSTLMVGPLWTRSRHPALRLFGGLFVDALREPLPLFAAVLPAYWRTGVWRWWTTWRRYASDVAAAPTLPPRCLLLAGARDPLPDRTLLPIMELPGAHACHFSHPEALAARLRPEC